MDMDEIQLKAIGNRIARQRESCHVTQETLANKTNLSVKHISVIENGSKAMRMDTMVKICQVLDIDYTYLLTGKKIAADMLEMQDMWRQLKPYQRDVMMQLLETFKKDNSNAN